MSFPGMEQVIAIRYLPLESRYTLEKSLFMPENIFPGFIPPMHFHGFEAKQKHRDSTNDWRGD